MSAVKERLPDYGLRYPLFTMGRIAGHSVSLSFAKEPDVTAAQRVRTCLIDSFIRQDTARRGAA